jgi:threonine synthase
VWRETQRLIDPHTAVGIAAARAAHKPDARTPVIALSTAHPAKFPAAIEKATGIHPSLPPHLADIYDRTEYFDVLPNSQSAVEDFIRQRIGGAAKPSKRVAS